MKPFPIFRAILPALALVLAACSVPARADYIEEGLLKKAPDILKFLKDREYKNVGVLRFQVQKGRNPATYNAGPINTNMADRLEKLLILGNDLDKEIGIIHEASKVAAAKAPGKHWSESDPKQRATLFEHAYPLAWGDEKVKADAFLLGRVKFSEDQNTTTVLIACFDRKSDKESEVCRFDVPIDRTALADAGISYVISRRTVKKRGEEAKTAGNLDELFNNDAAKSARDRVEKKADASNDYLEFEVFYDDEAQELKADPSEGGLRMAPPRPGQVVNFRLKNKGEETLGVVVFVNGKSTLEYMTDPAEMCTRWILKADGNDYWIKGYVDDKGVNHPFKVVDADDDLIKNELADKLGLIEVVVFLKGMKQPAKAADEKMLVSRSLSLRQLSPYYQKKLGVAKKPKTAAEARNLAFKSLGLKPPVKSRGIGDGEGGFIVPDPSLSEQLQIGEVEFPNPEPIATPIVIRYNEKPAK